MKNITKHQSIISSKYAHPTTRSESSVLYLLPVAPMRGLPLTSDSCLSQEHISNFKNKTRQETLRQAFGIVSHAYQSIVFLKNKDKHGGNNLGYTCKSFVCISV
jgi:hypothetical protein